MSKEPGLASEPIHQRYRLTIAYDGSLFHGWQKQEPPGLLPLRTVAGVVETGIRDALKQPITLVGASRTDAGVHAMGQTAHFDAATRIPLDRLPLAINSRLPDDVLVLAAAAVPDDFQAIGGAVSKQYRYRLFNAHRRPLHLRHCQYHCWHRLDVAAMNAAGKLLVGTHDFAGFAAANHQRLTTVRTIFDLHVERVPLPLLGQSPADMTYPALPGHEAVEPAEVAIVVQGSGFLYNMVRIIAGTLVEVGRGAMPVEQVAAAIETADRRLAGPTLGPEGLWLEWIRYAGDPVQDGAAGIESPVPAAPAASLPGQALQSPLP